MMILSKTATAMIGSSESSLKIAPNPIMPIICKHTPVIMNFFLFIAIYCRIAKVHINAPSGNPLKIIPILLRSIPKKLAFNGKNGPKMLREIFVVNKLSNTAIKIVLLRSL